MEDGEGLVAAGGGPRGSGRRASGGGGRAVCG